MVKFGFGSAGSVLLDISYRFITLPSVLILELNLTLKEYCVQLKTDTAFGHWLVNTGH